MISICLAQELKGLQRFLKILCDDSAEHKVFVAEKHSWSSFFFQKLWTAYDTTCFSTCCGCWVCRTSQTSWCSLLLHALPKDYHELQRQVKSLPGAADRLRETYRCSIEVKIRYFVNIAFQCLLADCRTSILSLV